MEGIWALNDKNKNRLGKFDLDLTPIRDFIHHMDSFFNQSFNQMNSFMNLRHFRTNVYETDSQTIVEANLQDYKKDQIQIEILDNRLRIAVEDRILYDDNTQKNKINESKSFQRMERFVTFPFSIPKEETKATYKNGVLKIIIPNHHKKRKYIDIHDSL